MSDQVLSQPLNQVPAEPSRGSRRKGTLGIGLLLLLGGVGAGAALFVNAGSQYKEAVVNLQRAPVGCDTELDFTGTGTFIMYIESKGRVGQLRGDCENSNTDYEREAGASRPVVALTLVDANGDEVDLKRTTDASYDVGGFVGNSTKSVTIDEPAKYTLSVESDDTDFAIAIGRDPKSDFEQQRLIALVVAGAGLLIGGLLTVLGLRRTAAASSMGAPGAPTGEAIGEQHHDGHMEPPSWAPAEPVYPTTTDAGYPLQPQTNVQPQTPLAPPSWQPPHADEPEAGSGTGWGAPQQ